MGHFRSHITQTRKSDKQKKRRKADLAIRESVRRDSTIISGSKTASKDNNKLAAIRLVVAIKANFPDLITDFVDNRAAKNRIVSKKISIVVDASDDVVE